MKRFLILLILCILTLNVIACNEGIKLITSTKQTIIQGINKSKPYTKYLFEIALDNTVDISVDSVVVYNSGRCLKVNHYLSKSTTQNKLTLDASLNEGNYEELKNCNGSSEKVIIHYKVNNKSGKLKVSSFKEETVTRR
ncbi:hypothetical protein [Kordia sp.]|uniref:hypothetical protein n=1 Tax=Kordia sp. TaxID=1965332 RepID=UPI003D6BCE5B